MSSRSQHNISCDKLPTPAIRAVLGGHANGLTTKPATLHTFKTAHAIGWTLLNKKDKKTKGWLHSRLSIAVYMLSWHLQILHATALPENVKRLKL